MYAYMYIYTYLLNRLLGILGGAGLAGCGLAGQVGTGPRSEVAGGTAQGLHVAQVRLGT